ncbi:MAG TPA: TonB-dependent receptor, partial [Bacteroidetes bacterium]|nr:TonB-dependent receptor [Bacteroidota bacterium]
MRLWFLLLFIVITLSINGQIIIVTGHVRDLESNEPLSFSNIIVKGTTTGVSADLNGSYAISLDFSNKENITLMASYVGYMSKEMVIAKGVKKFDFYLETVGIFAKEIVVSASRVGESLMSAPISIQKLNAQAIRNSASGDFYQSLGNLSGIDVVTSSMGFKTINTRGFNTTSPVRSVQFIDGMDNQAPGLNFPIGNLVGASEMDLKNIEIISGAASALYGANAFQGVIN